MARYLVSGGLILVGFVHLLPAIGVVSEAQLTRLYGLPFRDPDLLILMRHRAVLFGILGLLLLAAAFHQPLQPTALLAGIVSVGSFLALAWTAPDYNAHIARVFAADVVALVLLLVAAAAWWTRT